MDVTSKYSQLKRKRLRDTNYVNKASTSGEKNSTQPEIPNVRNIIAEECTAPATKHERLELLRTLDSVQDLPPKLRRLRRKLVVTLLKQTDTEDGSELYQSECCVGITKLIRYDCLIKCRFTDRTLKPIIYQNFELKPSYLLMHEELCSKVKLKYPRLDTESRVKYPVNFVYIHPGHVAALNSLSVRHFWPGIDLTSALEFPEFSCIAVYRRIIVGFGLMSPGEHLNDAYLNYLLVRPGWRQCGIATFILYHLTQTCLTWNITLHVSPSNDSSILYQKFGFKSHHLLRNFYDKYTPALSNQSKHAFYMKLARPH